VSSNYDEVMAKHFFRTKTKTKTQESLQTTTSQMCPKARFFWGPSSSEKSEETLSKSEEEDTD